jgi:cyclohexanone monooxygenase
MSGSPLPTRYEVLVVGSGFGGLCMGVKLKQAGIEDFAILERDAALGGTWRVNDYPGAACDVPSHLYSFSFAQRADWSRKFPSRAELWDYTRSVAEDFGLMPHIRLATGMEAADYDAASGLWQVRTPQGVLTARFLVISVGAFGRPAIPDIPGLETFKGVMFHTSRWDHGFDHRGKRVAVIGTGASAIQIVPELAPQVAHLALFQRTPPWILPRPDREISGFEKRLLAQVKPLQWLYRLKTYLQYEVRALAMVYRPALAEPTRQIALRHLHRQVADETLRAKLTPQYQLGCKRVLLMNDYYPALTRDNVALVTDGIAEIRSDRIVTKAGEEIPVDAIVLGTGFDVEQALGPVSVRGRGGRSLTETADGGGLEAYKGCAVAGFPNLFMITGPNTGLGHNSMIYMIESGVAYVIDAIRQQRRDRWRSAEVRADVQARYNADLQRRLSGTVWASGCRSWYLDHNGKNRTLWPGFTFAYRWMTRRFDAANYILEAGAPSGSTRSDGEELPLRAVDKRREAF